MAKGLAGQRERWRRPRNWRLKLKMLATGALGLAATGGIEGRSSRRDCGLRRAGRAIDQGRGHDAFSSWLWLSWARLISVIAPVLLPSGGRQRRHRAWLSDLPVPPESAPGGRSVHSS